MNAHTLPPGGSSPVRPAVLVAFCALLALPLHAQLFDLGFKGGVNRDDLQTDYQHQGLVGGHLGLFARVKAPFVPGVQGELLLSSFGANVTVEGQTADLRSVALQVPLFIVISFGPAELHGGGYYEHYFTRTLATDFNVDLSDLPVEAGRLNDTGYGFLIGGGLRLRHFYVGVRYNIGMAPLGSGPYLEDARTRQLQGYIGWGLFKAN